MTQQMTPKRYPKETLISGVSLNSHFSAFSTVQGNAPDEVLNNIGIYFWDNVTDVTEDGSVVL